MTKRHTSLSREQAERGIFVLSWFQVMLYITALAACALCLMWKYQGTMPAMDTLDVLNCGLCLPCFSIFAFPGALSIVTNRQVPYCVQTSQWLLYIVPVVNGWSMSYYSRLGNIVLFTGVLAAVAHTAELSLRQRQQEGH